MRRWHAAMMLGAAMMTLMGTAACNSDEATEQYPPIVTEFASVTTDKEGTMTTLRTDDEHEYSISNRPTGYKPEVTYRVVCGFVPQEKTAEVYQMWGAHLLRDSSEVHRLDPVDVTSAWRRGRFINMVLQTRTRGGDQWWGFTTDSIRPGHTYLSLHHGQNADPMAYTETVYASVPLDSLKETSPEDCISLRVTTFNGVKEYTFK